MIYLKFVAALLVFSFLLVASVPFCVFYYVAGKILTLIDNTIDAIKSWYES